MDQSHSQPGRIPRADLWALIAIQVVLAGVFLFSRASGTDSAWVGLPLDDAWIHLVYARSLAEHLSFAYNPGQLEAGMTSPLWCVLAAPLVRVALWFGWPAPLATKLLGIAAAGACALVLYRMTRELTGSRMAALGAALVPALEPSLGFARVSGMEVWLAALLLAASAWAALRGDWLRAGVLVGLGVWTRPEMMLWALILPAAILVGARVGSGGRQLKWRDVIRYGGPILLAALIWMGYCLAVTGRPLPNTWYAKYRPVEGLELGAWFDAMWVHYVRAAAWNRWGPGLLLAAAGALLLFRRRPALVLAFGLYPVLYALAQSRNQTFFVPSASFAFDRYYEPGLLLWLALAGMAAGLGIDALRGHFRAIPRGAGFALTLVLALGLAAVFARLPGRVWLYSWNTQNIEELQVAAGRWLRETTAGAPSMLALNDAGAIRFESGCPAVDLMGLNTHELSGVDVMTAAGWQLLERQRVEWIAVIPAWFPQFARIPSLTVAREFAAANYTLKRNSGWDRTIVYRAAAGLRAEMAVPIFLERGDQLATRGLFDEALREYREAELCAPGDTAVARRVASARRGASALAARVTELRSRASGLAPLEIAELADLSARTGSSTEAARFFEQARGRARTPEERIRIAVLEAQSQVQAKQGVAALTTLREAYRREPHPALGLQLAKLATQGQRFRLAKQTLSAIVAENRGPEIRGAALVAEAELAARSGDLRLARSVEDELAALPVDAATLARIRGWLSSATPAKYDWD